MSNVTFLTAKEEGTLLRQRSFVLNRLRGTIFPIKFRSKMIVMLLSGNSMAGAMLDKNVFFVQS